MTVPVSRSFYQLRVAGTIGPAARDALSQLTIDVHSSTTVLSGALDREGLHQVLDLVRAFGLELVEIRQHAI